MRTSWRGVRGAETHWRYQLVVVVGDVPVLDRAANHHRNHHRGAANYHADAGEKEESFQMLAVENNGGHLRTTAGRT